MGSRSGAAPSQPAEPAPPAPNPCSEPGRKPPPQNNYWKPRSVMEAAQLESMLHERLVW